MGRSTPSSPDPSAFRLARATNKVHSENTDSVRMKCLQKLPNMSPKLSKLFNLKSKLSRGQGEHSKSGEAAQPQESAKNLCPSDNMSLKPDNVERERMNENGVKPSNGLLGVIEEKDITSDTEGVSPRIEGSGPAIADLVLSLLKNKRKNSGYSSVDNGEQDKDQVCSNIKIDNLNKVKTCSRPKGQTSVGARKSSSCRMHEKRFSERRTASMINRNPPYSAPPTIVLTHTNNSCSRY